jgi:hypothetical protein
VNSSLKKDYYSQVPVAHPVILATQEAEIRRITVQSQSQQNSSQDPILKKTHPKKRAGRVAQGVGPEFKSSNPSTTKEKERLL